MTATNSYHKPVLLTESIDALNIKEEGIYVDVTFGGGGHSREILNRLGKKDDSMLLTKMRMLLKIVLMMNDLRS